MSVIVAAETRHGRIRGVEVAGIKQFRGVAYGADTGGRARFKAPVEPQPWPGVRDAFAYGDICPQAFTNPAHAFGLLIDWDLHPGGMSEDCLNLNIWTPGLRDGGKRPILVYFHGGALSTGSANHYCFVGDRLSRYGDAVVVTVNHRLSAFGYLDLAALGAPEAYSAAGVAGMLDLVLALRWVRDNAAEFGGDSEQVMIFGQSGGGRKVNFVQAMPAARGLFQRAATQSGGSVRALPREIAAAHATALLQQLGVGKDFERLAQLSFGDILEAQVAIGAYDYVMHPGAQVGDRPNFTPVVDGAWLPRDPFDPTAPEESAHAPMLIGYCAHDLGWSQTNFDLDEPRFDAVAAGLAGARGAEAAELYRQAYPTDTPFLRQASMLTHRNLLQDLTLQAERKAAQGASPVWMYRFDWRSPWAGGRFGAVHGADMSLVFHNTHQPTVCNSEEAAVLAGQMSDAWLAFARTGDPNCASLPEWPSYEPSRRVTLRLNATANRCDDDPDGVFRRFWKTEA